MTGPRPCLTCERLIPREPRRSPPVYCDKHCRDWRPGGKLAVCEDVEFLLSLPYPFRPCGEEIAARVGYTLLGLGRQLAADRWNRPELMARVMAVGDERPGKLPNAGMLLDRIPGLVDQGGTVHVWTFGAHAAA